MRALPTFPTRSPARAATFASARTLATLIAAALLSRPAHPQWSPATGHWLKDSATDVRVMTFNVADGLCSSNDKEEGPGNWCALARLVAALKPDVLLLQEAGDNEGNGTGPISDSASELAATLDLFLHGGNDPFKPGAPPVTAHVQLYDPDFDLPFVFVSLESDGFNRNAICSRFPFGDLNGDGAALLSDMPPLLPDGWSLGGDGGIRGWGLAEIDLPDGTYAGDLVVGNSHLKSGTSAASHDQRIAAAQDIAWCMANWWSGGGTGVPDPHGVLADEPPATNVLPPKTPLITAGDWNEDETKNGAVKGPADWISQAAVGDAATGGTGDGPDRDGSDMILADARDVLTGSEATIFTNRYDYVAYEDSIATLRRSFVFSSASLPADGSATPAELEGFAGGAPSTSYAGSDHRPVIADFILPPAVCNDAQDLGGGTPGGSGLAPHFTACGTLASGQRVVFRLQDAPPSVLAVPVIGLGLGDLPLGDGTLLPSPPLALPGFVTSQRGCIVLMLAGGGGPLDLVVQWVVLDRDSRFGTSLSNALQVRWLP